MGNFDFYLPEKIIFGKGRISETGKICSEYGKKGLLVSDPFCVKSGLAKKILGFMTDAGLEVSLFDGVVPNPTTDSIDKCASDVKKNGCSFVVGLGGGSAIDTAKGAAVALSHPEPIWNYAIGKSPITGKTLPVIAITTTSGTGSHCTCFSVITNPITHQKPGMGSPFILPKVTIVDPELMLSMPRGLTAICGFDVFSHAVEAYTSNVSSPLSDIFAEKAISIVTEQLPKCYSNGNDIDAREQMAVADTCAGIAICHAVVSLAHVIAHVIGGHYPQISHGDALFTIYREVLAFNLKADSVKEKHRFIARALSGGTSDNLCSSFDKFFAQFDFENKLISLKPDNAALTLIAEDTFTYMKGITDLNPVQATVKDVENILQNSLKKGWK